MQYYQCMFSSSGGAYSLNMYDLKTNNETEIKHVLEQLGHEVLEIYDIKKQ